MRAIHDWSLDSYVRGTWCNFRPNQFSKYLKKAQTAEGRLFFAGSDIANGCRFFFDGAIESGIRTAHKVMQEMLIYQ